MTQRNNQVGGDHYAKQAIDPFTFAMANRWDPMMASILKYLSRYPDKGTPAQDLRKAAHIARYRCEFDENRETLSSVLMSAYIDCNQFDAARAELLWMLDDCDWYMSIEGQWKAALEALATACEAEACKYE
jgi:hypothetical protein